MSYSPLLQELIDALRCLPGVGPKSAQRMAVYLLDKDRSGANNLSDILRLAMEKIGYCQSCRTFSETDICSICSNPRRDNGQLCIVENPADVIALEESADFSGKYFVLRGRLSPLDGIGPADLGLDVLKKTLETGSIKELILATNPTVEGEVTAHYIAEMAKTLNVKVTRIAHGIPLGGELEFVDGGTLSHAFLERKTITD